MKGKFTMVVTIGVTSMILVAVMFTQFKTVEQTDITAIETMRETQLRAELSNWKTKYDEVTIKLDEINLKLLEYQEQISNNTDSSALLHKELEEANKYLGYTDVIGDGVIITLSNSEYADIDAYDLLKLVNELRLAGAEAISINDERIVAMTDIVEVQSKFILVNTRRVSGPFVIKAIGDPKYLESSIIIKGGYIDETRASDKNVEYRTENGIQIGKFEGVMQITYAEPSV